MSKKNHHVQLCEFKPQAIQGLYIYDHFQHECGAFIQRYLGFPSHWILQDTNGERHKFYDHNDLKDYLASNKV